MKIIDNIIKKHQNYKIIEIRKQLKEKENIILALLCFINDRKEMDVRNMYRAEEIERICFVNGKTPEITYEQVEGIINEIKSSIVASQELLNRYKQNSIQKL